MRRKDPAGKKRFYGEFVSLRFYLQATDILSRRKKLWRDFLKLIVNEKDFIPERYDPDEEPPRFIFEPKDIFRPLEVLMKSSQDILFERYDPYYIFYSVDTGSIVNASPYNSEGMSLEISYFNKVNNIEKIISFSIKLYELFNPLYGRICHQSDRDSQNTIYTYFPKGHPYEGKVYSQTGFGGDTRKGIPGIYWANFFGKIYIETIGKEKFLTVPCFKKEELNDGGFLILTSESPLDWEKPEVQQLRKAMRDHLGYEYFSDINNRDRVCKVPPFDFSVWEKECERGMKIPDRFKDQVKK